MDEIIKTDSQDNAITQGFYCSMQADSQADRLKIFDAVSNADSLENIIGQRIEVSGVVVQPVEQADRLTGEIRTANRIVLMCADGKSYGCMSSGVETSMRNLMGIVGMPPYDPPIPLVPVKKMGRNGYRFTTLELAK